MPLLLTIETATDVCSVCLSKGHEVLAIKEATDAYQHIEVITLLIDEVLQTAKVRLENVDAIVVSSGPGSYTALRVGAATAKGICYAKDKPMIAIPTLQSLAWAMQEKGKTGYFMPMIDARRMEVYTALYDENLATKKDPQALLVTPESVKSYLEADTPVYYGGNGAAKCREVMPKSFIYKEIRCNAQNLVSLAIEKYRKQTFEDLAYFSPYYLKPPNITISKKKL